MPINIYNDFSQLTNLDDFRRFVSAWAKKVHSEINNVISTNLAKNTSSITQLNDNLGNLKQQDVVVSLQGSSLQIARGAVDQTGLPIRGGEDFTCSLLTVGQYQITFTKEFNDSEVVVLATVDGGAAFGAIGTNSAITTKGFTAVTYTAGAGNPISYTTNNIGFSFIALGKKILTS